MKLSEIFKKKPSSIEVINGIVSLFTLEEFDSLKFNSLVTGKTYDFKDQLIMFCGQMKPKYSVKKSKEKIFPLIKYARPTIPKKTNSNMIFITYIKDCLFEI